VKWSTQTNGFVIMYYRRAYILGGTYFFTVNLLNRKTSLLTDHINHLRKAINTVKKQRPFKLDAMVIMPEHLHAMITLPESDADFSTRWMLIKSTFSRSIPRNEKITLSRQSKGERGIWQRRFWEHSIRDNIDYENHINYIHYNPVKHGYVSKASDWPYSTIHQYIKNNLLNENLSYKNE